MKSLILIITIAISNTFAEYCSIEIIARPNDMKKYQIIAHDEMYNNIDSFGDARGVPVTYICRNDLYNYTVLTKEPYKYTEYSPTTICFKLSRNQELLDIIIGTDASTPLIAPKMGVGNVICKKEY